ncbi:MAG: hypothetical protein DRJ65_05525 [Acidobacteria bacterium]|nr:MAG: hypothetical protein DRJ65_05525 [Acidobacteriota bacterium]
MLSRGSVFNQAKAPPKAEGGIPQPVHLAQPPKTEILAPSLYLIFSPSGWCFGAQAGGGALSVFFDTDASRGKVADAATDDDAVPVPVFWRCPGPDHQRRFQGVIVCPSMPLLRLFIVKNRPFIPSYGWFADFDIIGGGRVWDRKPMAATESGGWGQDRWPQPRQPPGSQCR